MPERTEHDLLGQREIPADALWGIHTLRAHENFPYSVPCVNSRLIIAMAHVKLACCQANSELGYLSHSQSEAIGSACREIITGDLREHFPLSFLQGGAGTSLNMNINEVIANRALQLLGSKPGAYNLLHPIDHVNLHQSTNDVFPTALRIAAIGAIRELAEAIAGYQGVLQRKEKEFSHIVTIGRTEMQDAVPMTLGAQFSACADAIARDRWRTFKCEERLRVVNIGGTAIGTGLTAPRSYIFLVIEKLRAITGFGLTRGDNVVDQTANQDAFSEVAGILGAHASMLTKIANDLRTMHMLGEIRLPAVQTGSSIMPGKVNPVICEAAISSAMRVRSNVFLINEAVGAGTMQINEFLPIISWALLESLDILITTNRMLTLHVEHISANPDVCHRRAWASPTLITVFLPYIGYERSQDLVQRFELAGQTDFRAFLIQELGQERVDRLLSPENIMSLGHRVENTNTEAHHGNRA